MVLASGGASLVEGGVVVWELLCRGIEKWGAFVELFLQCWRLLLKRCFSARILEEGAQSSVE